MASKWNNLHVSNLVYDTIECSSSQFTLKESACVTGDVMLSGIKNNQVGLYDYQEPWNTAFITNSGVDTSFVATIKTDSSNNLYVCGMFINSITFGAITLTATNSNSTVFVAKRNSAGTWLWASQSTSTGVGGTNVETCCMVLDSSNNIYITGDFEDNATFGSTTLTNTPDRDVFIAKLDSSGNWLWAFQSSHTIIGSQTSTYDIALDSSNNIYIAGYFVGDVIFGSTTLTSPSIIISDVYVAKMNTSGSLIWAIQPTSSALSTLGYGIGIDASDNVYVSGLFENTVTFGPDTLTTLGNGDIFVAKANSSGTWLWGVQSTHIGTVSINMIRMDVNLSGYIYISSSITIQNNSIFSFNSFSITNKPSPIGVVMKLDSNGTCLWGSSTINEPTVNFYNITLVPNGNEIVVCGMANGSGTITLDDIITGNEYGGIMVCILDNATGNWLYAYMSESKADGTESSSVTVDTNYNIYTSGGFGSTGAKLIFGNTTVTSTSPSIGFIAKTNPPLLYPTIVIANESGVLNDTISCTTSPTNLPYYSGLSPSKYYYYDYTRVPSQTYNLNYKLGYSVDVNTLVFFPQQ